MRIYIGYWIIFSCKLHNIEFFTVLRCSSPKCTCFLRLIENSPLLRRIHFNMKQSCWIIIRTSIMWRANAFSNNIRCFNNGAIVLNCHINLEHFPVEGCSHPCAPCTRGHPKERSMTEACCLRQSRARAAGFAASPGWRASSSSAPAAASNAGLLSSVMTSSLMGSDLAILCGKVPTQVYAV